jgi:hypothetical protein
MTNGEKDMSKLADAIWKILLGTRQMPELKQRNYQISWTSIRWGLKCFLLKTTFIISKQTEICVDFIYWNVILTNQSTNDNWICSNAYKFSYHKISVGASGGEPFKCWKCLIEDTTYYDKEYIICSRIPVNFLFTN